MASFLIGCFEGLVASFLVGFDKGLVARVLVGLYEGLAASFLVGFQKGLICECRQSATAAACTQALPDLRFGEGWQADSGAFHTPVFKMPLQRFGQ